MDSTLSDRVLFSIYGISIEHPKDWKICFDPKRGVSYESGFFRIEDFVPRKGAQLSLSLNWEAVSSDNAAFAQNFCDNISRQYKAQLKKTPYQIESKEIIDFRGGKAAFVVSGFRATLGFIKRASDAPVRVIQLGYYDEASGRAVASAMIGRPDLVRTHETLLRELVCSVKCHSCIPAWHPNLVPDPV